jgi:hypothetical protein
VNVIDSIITEDADARLQAYLFPAEDTDPGQGVSLVPRERFSGTPQYYLLHVLPEVMPDADLAGRGLVFDGVHNPGAGQVADFVSTGVRTSLEMSTAMTVEAWIRPTGPGTGGFFDATTNAGGIIVNREGEYEIARFSDGTIRWAFANANPGWTWVNTGVRAELNEWTHVSVVYDRGRVDTYKNGVLAHTFQGAGNIGDIAGNQDDFRIGGRQAFPADQNFAGTIDEVRVWNTARTAEEVRRNFQRVLSGQEAGLQGYWRFEEVADGDPLTTGNQVRDLTANGNHGTLFQTGNASFTFGTPRSGVPLVSEFGVGQYRIKFLDPLGDTVQVDATEASKTFSSIELLGQPVYIPLGDVNGDGYGDAVVSVRDGVGTQSTFARIAFGTPTGLDPNLYGTPITLSLPAPLLAGTTSGKAEIVGVGDIDGDGIDDIGIAITQTRNNATTGALQATENQGAYVVFGRTDWRQQNVAADAGLVGEYYDLPANVRFSSNPRVANVPFDNLTPRYTRVDANVDVPNGGGPGFAGFADLNDFFAVRWSGQIRVETAGAYTFHLGSDDGSRLFIDGQLVIDHDGLHAYTERSGSVTLSAGYHDIRVEMFEFGGFAGVRLDWDPPGAAGREVVPGSVLFRDARDVLDITTDRDLFLPNASVGEVSIAGAGNVTPIAGRGLFVEYFDLSENANVLRLPTSFAKGKFLRSDVAGDEGAITVVLQDLPEHDVVDVEFLLALLDGWAGLADGGDRFVVRIDGNVVLDAALSSLGEHEGFNEDPGVLMREGQLGFGAGADRLLDMGRSPVLQSINHTGSSLTLEILAGGDGYRAGTFESFAIDNLRIAVRSTQGTIPSGDDVTAVPFLTNFDTVLPDTLSGGTVTPVQGFGITQANVEITSSESPFYYIADTGEGLGNAPTLGAKFAVRWTGQFLAQTEGVHTFAVGSTDGARLYIDGVLVGDADGVHDYAVITVPVTLTAGLHDIRYEYFSGGGGDFKAALLYVDLPGGNAEDYIFVDGTLVSRGEANRSASERADDLLVSFSGTGTQRLFGGRTREEWLIDSSATFAFDGVRGVSVGDQNGDGSDDFVTVVPGGTPRLMFRAGGNGSGEPALFATLQGIESSTRVFRAGDVDNDGVGDLLLDGPGRDILVFGGSLSGTVVLSTLLGNGSAIELANRGFRGIGDFNGDGRDDLAAAVMVSGTRLNEAAQLEHQVTQVFLSGQSREVLRLTLGVADPVPDLQFEPGRASFSTPGAVTAQPLLFSGAEEFTVNGVTYTRLAIAGPAGDALRLYNGNALGDPLPTDTVATITRAPASPYVFDLARPQAPGSGPREVPGINVATQSTPQLRDAFALAGDVEAEALTRSVILEDLNGDRMRDLLVTGSRGSYVLLGPVGLNGVNNVADEADLLISANVGRAADRMGDVNGDGFTDLLFIRRADNNVSTVITAVLGGLADGIELPRVIDRDWIEDVLAVSGQNRVRQLSVASPNGNLFLGRELSNAGASFSVVNWNDDGFADLLVVSDQLHTNANGNTQVAGYVFNGLSFWGGEDLASSTAAGRIAMFTAPSTNVVTEAQALLNDGGGQGSVSSRAVASPRLSAIARTCSSPTPARSRSPRRAAPVARAAARPCFPTTARCICCPPPVRPRRPWRSAPPAWRWCRASAWARRCPRWAISTGTATTSSPWAAPSRDASPGRPIRPRKAACSSSPAGKASVRSTRNSRRKMRASRCAEMPPPAFRSASPSRAR